MFNRPEPNLT
jgi:hypothetical protein